MLGPSGCGKTTTLRIIAGLEQPTAERILLHGRDVTWERAAKRDIAFVFQLFALYPHMSVRRNISFPLRLAGLPRREVRARAEGVARMLEIGHLLDRGVGGRAAGDRQRVALGRALVRRPNLFLMDEPLSSLDAKLREDLRVELKRIQRDLGATIVYVTHDQLEAMTLADRVARVVICNAPAADWPADFYSVGTNDLIQYVTAAARDNPAPARLADPRNPAVLQLIRRTVEAGGSAGSRSEVARFV